MVGIFSFLLVTSIVALVVAAVLMIVRFVKNRPKRTAAVMAAVSALLFAISFVGVGVTYNPSPEQIAERERMVAEKEAAKAERERQKAEETARKEAEEATQRESATQSASVAPVEPQTPKPEPTPNEREPVSSLPESQTPRMEPSVSSEAPDQSEPVSPAIPEESELPAESENLVQPDTSLSPSPQYDALQQLYLDISPEMTYTEMLAFVTATGLPFSEEKYNGSRVVQVAFTEGCTAQSYKTEVGDYLEIHYDYPKDENSVNDELEKYYFSTCAYVPCDSWLTLVHHSSGYYFSIYEPGNYIMRLGSVLDLDATMSREEQLKYYFENSEELSQ